MRRILVLLALVSSACSPGPSAVISNKSDVALIGGTPAKPGDEIARSVVQLREKGTHSRAICTGVLISKTMVLTAAHCILALRPDRQNLEYREDFEVVFSVDVMTSDRSLVRGVKEIFTHANYEPDYDRCPANPEIDGCKQFLAIPKNKQQRPHMDAAVIVLDKAAPRGMVPLKTFQGKPPSEFEAVATGGGHRVLTKPKVTLTLAEARKNSGRLDFYNQTLVLSPNPFDFHARNAWGYSDGTFCIEAKNDRTTTYGDSGSPLLIRTPKGLQIFGVLHGGSENIKVGNRVIEQFKCYTDLTRDNWVGMNAR